MGKRKWRNGREGEFAAAARKRTRAHAVIRYFAGDHFVKQHAEAPYINLSGGGERRADFCVEWICNLAVVG